MSTAMAPRPAEAFPDHLVLYDMDWDFYEDLLERLGDRRLYVTYDDGNLEIMSPLPEHEKSKKIIGGCIALLAMEMNIPMGQLGSTTFKRKDRGKGLEPDECFYIRHEAEIRSKKRLELDVNSGRRPPKSRKRPGG